MLACVSWKISTGEMKEKLLLERVHGHIYKWLSQVVRVLVLRDCIKLCSNSCRTEFRLSWPGIVRASTWVDMSWPNFVLLFTSDGRTTKMLLGKLKPPTQREKFQLLIKPEPCRKIHNRTLIHQFKRKSLNVLFVHKCSKDRLRQCHTSRAVTCRNLTVNNLHNGMRQIVSDDAWICNQ